MVGNFDIMKLIGIAYIGAVGMGVVVRNSRQQGPGVRHAIVVLGDTKDRERSLDLINSGPTGRAIGHHSKARIRLAELKRGTQVASVAPTAPSLALEVTSLDQKVVVSSAAKLNLHEVPGGPKVGGLKSGDKVEVTSKAQHEGALWYRVAVAGGAAGFVFVKYLSDKPLTAVKPATGVYPKPPLLAPGMVFQDCPDCPEMVVVPPGEFMMGSTGAVGDWFLKQGGQQEWLDWERPCHRVSISQSFAAGKTKVTVGQYRKFTKATNRPDGDGCHVYVEFDGKLQWKEQADRNWRNPGYPQTDTHPVTCVRWDDATAYVKWLSGHTGEAYRLLSEVK